jgi:hypothetical protein
VICCVAPQELADELYEKLVAYYAEDPNVEVIVDRRRGERTRLAGGRGAAPDGDRRRPRVPGEFPPV